MPNQSQGTPTGTKLLRLLRAFGALLLLGVVLVGPPLALVLWGNWPITGLPSGEHLRDLPASLATESALFGAMTLAAGFIWLLFLVSAAIETIAELQNRHLADVPMAGPIQTFVRKLVAAALLSVSATGAPAGPLVPRRPAGSAGAVGPAGRPGVRPGTQPGMPATASHTSVGYQPGPPRPPTQDLRTGSPEQDAGAGPGAALPAAGGSSGSGPAGREVAGLPSAGGPTSRGAGPSRTNAYPAPPGSASGQPDQIIVVGDLDTPWSLAEQHLGDGMAWRDLFEANRDRPQPDGESWTDPEVLVPGWQLVLPGAAPDTARGTASGTADGAAPPAAVAPAAPTAPATSTPGPTTRDLNETLDYVPQPDPTGSSVAAGQADPVSGYPGPSDGASQPSKEHGTGGVPAPAAGPTRLASNGRPGDARGRVDALTRALTDDLARSPAADIVGLRVAPSSLDVLLAAPAVAPAGFETRATDATLWRAVEGGAVPPPEQRGERNIALLPALVSFGQAPEGTLLFDIERMGALSVEGDRQQVRAWLSHVASELASAPWASEIALRVSGIPGLDRAALSGSGPLVGPDDIEVVDDIGELTREAAAFAMATGTALDQRSTQAARITGGGPWSPMVIVSGAAPAPSGGSAPVPAELISLCRSGGGGLAVVAAGPFPQARWRMEIDGEGRATLHPWGVRLTVGQGGRT